MSPKLIIKLLFVLSVVAVAVMLYTWNSTDVTVQFSPNSPMEMPLAVALLVSFTAGLLLTAIYALYTFLKQSLREKKIQKQLDTERKARITMEEVRALLAAREYRQAESALKKIISSNPENTSARLLLAECYEAQGAFQEALLVLDNARQEDRGNAEVLFVTSSLNQELGNLTAALDNLELLLKAKPQNTEAISRASDIAWEIGDLRRAIDFKKRQIRLEPEYRDELLEELSDLEFDLLIEERPADQKAWLNQLNDFIKRHRDYGPALESLGDELLENGENSKAVKTLQRAFISSGSTSALEKLAARLVETNAPEKAVEVIKKSLAERKLKSGDTSVRGHLFFGALLLHFGNVEGATAQIEMLSSLEYLSSDEKALLAILKADITQREGDTKAALAQVKRDLLSELRISPPSLIKTDSEEPLLIAQKESSKARA